MSEAGECLGDTTPGLVRLLRTEIMIDRSFRLVVHRDARRIVRIEAIINWLRDEVSRTHEMMYGE